MKSAQKNGFLGRIKNFLKLNFEPENARFLYGLIKKTQTPLQILQKTNTFFNKFKILNMGLFGTVFVFAILAIVVMYFRKNVCFNKYRKNELIDREHWERMNNF